MSLALGRYEDLLTRRKAIIPEGNTQGKYDYFEGQHILISSLCNGNECFIPPGQRFGEFCQMKYFGHLCLQNYYFGTSLKLYYYVTKALNRGMNSGAP